MPDQTPFLTPTAKPAQAPFLTTPLVILDTNIVLDLFLFQDPRTAALRQALASGQLHWQATAHMRNELERVLTYAHIAAKLAFYERTPEDILAAFDQFAQIVEAPANKAPYTCKDADDQVFIDLACYLASQVREELRESSSASQGVQLISKDKAVLSMRKRLQKESVLVSMTLLV